MLLMDVSGSGSFGTTIAFKRDVMTEIAAVLSFSAIYNNDKIGVIFFSDKVEKFIPPLKGRKHILRIIRELLDFKPGSKHTNLDVPLRYLTNAIKKRCTAFIISDFMVPDFEDALRIASNKHDIVALKIFDPAEESLPDLGMINISDAESGVGKWIDTSSRITRMEYEKWWIDHLALIKNIFRKCGVDSSIISTDEDYVKPLMKLFKTR
jgi:uncharacterized protein (DUF58 family)